MAYFQTNLTGSGSLRRNVGRHFASAGIQCAYLFAMAGSRYTADVSCGTFETPFGLLEREVHDCVSTNNIKEVHLNYDLRFFAQEGNGFYDKEKPNRK